jgi:L-ascorbate metabolism protein UlaG (beta-lactamase superfamily)
LTVKKGEKLKKTLFLMAVLLASMAGIYAAKSDLNGVLKQIHWLHHASFMIETLSRTFYIDPYEIKGGKPADYIFITHDHPDHLSPVDIRKIAGKKTLIICTQASALKLKEFKLKLVKPGDVFTVGAMRCEAVPAYNNSKPFHSRKAGNVGYVIDIGGARIYHAGDTDNIPEMKSMKDIDIAMVPVGGFYTMEPKEAAEAIKAIKPKIAIPMHFGYHIGPKKYGKDFMELAGKYARVEILKEEEPR